MNRLNFALFALSLFACGNAAFAMDAMSSDDTGKEEMKMERTMGENAMKSGAKAKDMAKKKAHSKNINQQKQGGGMEQGAMRRKQ